MRDMWLERWVQRQSDNLGPWLRRRKQAMADWLDYQPMPASSRDDASDVLIPGSVIPELDRLNDADTSLQVTVNNGDDAMPTLDDECVYCSDSPPQEWPGAIAPGQHPWTVRLPDITPAQQAEAAAVAERVIDNLRGEAARADADRRRRFTEGVVT